MPSVVAIDFAGLDPREGTFRVAEIASVHCDTNEADFRFRFRW
jgi:hypothetical protein